MTMNRFLLLTLPVAMMIAAMILSSGMEHRLAALGTSAQAKLMLGRAGLALPYLAAAAIGIVTLFAANGSTNIKAAGLSVLAGGAVVIIVAMAREMIRLAGIASDVPVRQSVLAYADPATMFGAGVAFIGSVFALRVAIKGNAAFAMVAPKRIGGRRAIHGEADWMKMQEAAKLFPELGGIVIGERYRVDRDSVAALPFRAGDAQSWGAGGKSSLLCFDGSFGSSHGIVFAGSGGFKTTSVTIPTALKWGGGLTAGVMRRANGSNPRPGFLSRLSTILTRPTTSRSDVATPRLRSTRPIARPA